MFGKTGTAFKENIRKRKGVFLETFMGILLLSSFVFLSGEAAEVSREMVDQQVIVVDAGHGGIDPGMVGVGGLQEAGINLRIAAGLKEDLTGRGYEVVMTRKDDSGLYQESAANKKLQDLQERIAIIEKSGAALTVSIHQNSYTDPSVSGPQVFYYEDSAEGKDLALSIQERMNSELSPDSRREARGNKSYYLLKESKGIVNIVECGFLTNPEEAGLLQDPEYQKRAAKAIGDGIQEYLRGSRESEKNTGF